MSNMGDLDIVLSEYKLSDPQKNAVLEVISGETTNAKLNTLKSLEKKGLIFQGENGWYLEGEFQLELAPILNRNKAVFEAFDQGGVNGDADEKDVTKEVEAVQAAMFESVAQVEVFDYQLGVYTNTLMGFGDVYKWRNVIVWDGLTAEQIKEDIKTAFPINRKARRDHAKMSRRLIKAALKTL